MKFKKFQFLILLCFIGFLFTDCNGGEQQAKEDIPSDTPSEITPETPVDDPMDNLGIGPVKSVVLGELDQAMVEEGKKLYNAKCTACHNIKTRLIGPPQAGVLKRRSPEWVMNMILNPTEMIKKDPIAIKLLKEFNNVPMTEQGLTEEEARKILEYFRTVD
ncbi:MAG: cytochrome c [Flavobacteriales bacterium]|nr:cytochrome c [Flavobacteriales bacterium]